MRVQEGELTVKIWASARDTYDWAHRPGASWPCSQLSDHRLFAEFFNGDLVDLAIDGRMKDIDATEFNAFIKDKLGSINPMPKSTRRS
jgi:hypothetical protein